MAAAAGAYYKPPEAFDDDEPPSRPPAPHAAAGSLDTPDKARAAAQLITDSGLFISPDRTGKQAVESGVQALRAMDTPPRAAAAKRVMKRIFSQTLSPADPASLVFHEQASKKLKAEGDLSDTVQAFLRELLRMGQDPTFVPVIPLDHLRTLQDTGGFHFDAGDASHQIQVIAVSAAGVKYARINGGKLSSIFPGNDLVQVVRNIALSQPIAYRGNRELRMTPAGYVIECYKKNAVAYSSVFPIFMYQEFNPAVQEYRLTQAVGIPPAAAVAAAKQLMASGDFYQIKNQAQAVISVIVDIAPLFASQTGIARGILFKFDSKLFSS